MITLDSDYNSQDWIPSPATRR